MIQKETFLRVVDNSGVKYVKCLQVKKSPKSSSGNIGDVLVVSVKSMQRKTKFSSKIKKGDIFYAILVRTRSKLIKIDSQWLKFFDNAVVLVNKSLKPIANRIIGPVLKSLRQMKSLKLISISSGLV
jgi:large subunit ribosomal protein L14